MKKGKKWHLGMKVNTGTDADSALVHTLRGTSANVADVNMLGELLHAAEESLHDDSACRKDLKAKAEASALASNVNEGRTQQRPLDQGTASAYPARVSGPGCRRASVPGDQPVGACEGALPRGWRRISRK